MIRVRMLHVLSWARILVFGAILVLAACDSVEERVAKHYARGLELVAEGEYAKASLEFRNALKLDSEFVPAHFEMAKLQERERNVGGVVAHLTQIVELESGHIEARLKLAQIMMLADELDEAETHIAAALEVAPDNPKVLATKAEVALVQGDIHGALNAARATLELDHWNARAAMVLVGERIRAKDLMGALDLANTYLAFNDKDIALNLTKLQVLESLGDSTGVEAHLLRLTKIFPDRSQFRMMLAKYYERSERFSEAETQLRAIAEADPSNSDAALAVAQILYRTQGVEAARAELTRLIATAEDKLPFEVALAQLDHENSREDVARALLEESIARGGDLESVNTARVQLARFLIAEGDRVGARDLVEKAIAEDTKNVGALGVRAVLLMGEGDYDAAILDLRTALGEDPYNAALLQLEATAHERNGSPDLAGDRLASAVNASGYAPEVVLRYVRFLRRQGDINTVATVLEEAVRRRPGERELLAALGGARLRLRNWQGAERVVTWLRALGEPEARQTAEWIRAAALSGQEKFAETLDVLQEIAEGSDDAGSAMAAMVGTHVKAGQTAEAVVFVETQLARNPTDAQANLLRGVLHQLAGEADKAEERYRTAIAARPDNPSNYARLARFYLADRRREDAARALREGLSAIPEHPGLMLGLAGLLELEGDLEGAIDLYGRVYEARPDSVIAANNFASLVGDHRADDPASLERAFRAAKRLRASGVPQFQDTYGWLQYLRGDYGGALRSLLPAVEALPDNPWVRYHIGMTYAKLGKAAEARLHLEAALELAGDGPLPKGAEIRETLAELIE